ncbi:MAG TPA: tRNA preQ1(34) S-adenosylmethionine ribosyltransferase-isomerase QueA [Alphaproteobacteria bacterium]|nr:tRNA preQ1(34) S-adenosylmethionine ribosyltransferase-isomerase QueA [Alphaproteobacteria bacterium]
MTKNLNLLSSYDYHLPDELIATQPAEPRDAAKMLIAKTLETDKKFYDIIDYLNEGDLLIVNNTKVIPARIYCYRDRVLPNGNVDGKVALELLLHRPTKDALTWESFAKPAKRFKPGHIVKFEGHDMTAEVLSRDGDTVELKFNTESTEEFESFLDFAGEMPLPPYIAREDGATKADEDDYQTVYAEHKGSVAAPTAGLHFTDELIEKIKAKGIEFDAVMLHVGAGTFQPVKVDDVTEHKMHSEYGIMTQELADKIKTVKARGNKVIAVGTTSMRVLETANQQAFAGDTNIFIRPGYKFNTVDALITNFHLPKSTLLMLVSAFIGYDQTMKLYETAISNKFKFYSYGDACFLEKNDS